ncbi:glycoside hydrolase family 2 protein [Pengzhenrongella frigida]|uniref:glycoside hydrolase family 2 protein n=1 Tax=Pengzhenrongella frigida TaxID=1259133 RepID=UPI0013EB871B|nr:glycoside hydrolase family 2 protein [Cellulomonas sp. HLT2-17]
MQTTTLQDGWTVAATAGPVPADLPSSAPAEVPGCVHTDLLAVGAIGDPYLDANESALRWMHDVDWRYGRALTLAPAAVGERVDLVFDGIDTVSTVRLGGTALGSTANMHRSYRFDVRELADGAPRDLTVDLRSATEHAEEQRDLLGDRPAAYHPIPYNFVRKMACSFGWDWGPDLRTAGLWKDVRVERWAVARLAQVRPLVTVGADGAGRVEVQLEVERSGLVEAGELVVEVEVRGVRVRASVAARETAAVVVVSVPDAPLWWPVGYGAQPLADLTVTLTTALDTTALDTTALDTTTLDSWTRRIGFRTVELDTTDDEHGTRFTLAVNGTPVFVKGANWIPDDHFVTRITRDRLDRRLDQALDAHLNLVRVWGGGIFESEDFYAACDERGLLVWQDFLMACAAYPEESPLWEEVEAEARENVVRLMSHASLVLWNGGNENLWGHEDWGWKAQLGDATWGGRYATELYAQVVAELDPTRPYSDNSPYSPRRDPAVVHPNDPDHGSHHQWEVWNRVDYAVYRTEIPRFCSEFGFQGPPAWRTLADFVHADDGGALADAAAPLADPVFGIHQKADDGNGKLNRGMAPHLGVPSDFAHWHWAAQLNQARAVQHAVEHYRSWWPRTAGSIVWQLNDCWPVTSWAAIDSQERPKPLWFGLRHAYAPRLLTVVERDGAPALAAVNDTDEPWLGAVALRRETLAGVRLAEASADVAVPARSVQVVALDAALVTPGEPSDEVLVATCGEVRAVHLFAEDVDLRLDPAPVDATAVAVPGGYRVEVTARSLARDVTLLVDRAAADARVDDALVDLPAGASVSFLVTTAATIDPAVLTAAPVLRTANDLRAVALLSADQI